MLDRSERLLGDHLAGHASLGLLESVRAYNSVSHGPMGLTWLLRGDAQLFLRATLARLGLLTFHQCDFNDKTLFIRRLN